nr:unnamed protein product [Callosobruchus chinensis]
MFIVPPFKNITFMSPAGVYVNNMDLLITLNKVRASNVQGGPV